MAVFSLATERRWECPNCTTCAVSTEAQPHTPYHPCRGLRGLLAPLVPAGTRCEVRAVEREDWVGKEAAQTDGEGRPVMSVVTIRDDGTDCAVYAPTAQASAD